MTAMRLGASSSSVSSGIGRPVKATKSSTASRRLLPASWTFGRAGGCVDIEREYRLRSRPMAPANLRFPSAEWCAAYKDAINANPGYKAAGKDWTHGSVAMVVTAEPAIGIAEDMAMLLDVHQG